MTSPSTGETEIETSANAAPPKSNRISSFFSKLVGWSSRENISAAGKETKQSKKKRLTFFKNKNQEGKFF